MLQQNTDTCDVLYRNARIAGFHARDGAQRRVNACGEVLLCPLPAAACPGDVFAEPAQGTFDWQVHGAVQCGPSFVQKWPVAIKWD